MKTRICACGCGKIIKRERFSKRFPKSYIMGHQFRGSLNTNWKNGRRRAQGYVFVLRPGHPNADDRGYVREHVFVMSEHLGRHITKTEIVHHVNGIRDDNRLENLVITTIAKHTSMHHKGHYKPNSLKNLRRTTSEGMKHIWNTSRKHHRSKPMICDNCGASFYSRHGKRYSHCFCSLKCRDIFRKASHDQK